MDELKKTLEAAIEDFGVNAILKTLADIYGERAKEVRYIDTRNQWRATAEAIDRARLYIALAEMAELDSPY